MKKTFSVVAGVALALSMLLSMLGCGLLDLKKSEPLSIVGTWETELDFADMMNTALNSTEELAAMGLEFDGLNVTMLYTFNDDGTMSLKIDEEDMEEAIETMAVDILEAALDSMGIGMTLEEYLEMTGTSMDDLIDKIFAENSLTDAINQLEYDGMYQVIDNNLYMIKQGEEFDENVYTPISVNGDTMIMETPVGEDISDMENEGAQQLASEMFPMTLTKVA